MEKPIVSIVVPCFNEQEVLQETAKRLYELLTNLLKENKICENSKIVFVDDGSIDNTWNIIEELHKNNPQIFSGIKLSKNRGHQNALLCGLFSVKEISDCAVSIDADLQDDISIIPKMIEKFQNGYEIVLGVRDNRKTDSLFKRTTALLFYKFIKFLGADIVYNHADYRLMGKRALEALSQYGETNLFLRGLIPMLGFRTCIEYYARAQRFAGKSKYPFKKMLHFAFDGITSLSIKPIRYITMLGLFVSFVSFIMIIYFVYQHFSGITVIGWASMIVSIYAIGGLILFSIGIIGEYIGKIYLEIKRRPRFHIEEEIL